MTIHDDWLFDPDPTIRSAAAELYAGMADFPLICPHGHVEASLLAENHRFPEASSLFVRPDHYILRMLHSRGVRMESLGIGRCEKGEREGDPRQIWQRFAEHRYLFRGTPTAAWLDWELSELFEIDERLDGDNAQEVYDQIESCLQRPEFLPRALFQRFNIALLATTDDPADSLQDHHTISEAELPGRVIPTFRPDALFAVGGGGWGEALGRLREATGGAIGDYRQFVAALESRRSHFRSMGATATDHAVVEPRTGWRSESEIDAIFQRALDGRATAADEQDFQAHMLMEMARMSTEDGMVMQLHAGAFRNHNRPLFEQFGPDMGADIPVATEFTRNLRPLLNEFGSDPRLTLILFTLDESTYSRELAPLAGHYPAVRLGAPWWFHDSIEGIRRYLDRVTETAGIYNTVGFIDDTRAFCSIPARHAVARRIQANWLAGLVARHIIDMQDARDMARALVWDLPREAYRLDVG